MKTQLDTSKPFVNEIKSELKKINKFSCDIDKINVVVQFKNGNKYIRELEKY